MKKSIFILLAGLLILTIQACKSNQKNQEEIRQTLDIFFKNYKGDFRTVNRDLISQNLGMLIDKAIVKEKAEAAKIAKSDAPTDKPLFIEGDIFTSLYEGQDGFKIGILKIDGDKATVAIEFTNSKFKESWSDEVLLIRKEHWRIDNVIFKNDYVRLYSTKEVLQDFILTDNSCSIL